MKKNYPGLFSCFKPGLFLVVFLFFNFDGFGQTIGDATVTGTPVCAGSNVNISFEVTNGVYTNEAFTTGTNYDVYLSTRINGEYSSINTVIYSFTSSTAPSYNQYASAIINETVPIPSNYATNSNYVIWVGSSSPNTVSPYDSALFRINATPSNPTVSNNGPICVGGTLQLSASSITGATYQWTGPNGYTSTAQNPARTNATTAMAGVYTVVATVNGCSSNPMSTTVGGSVANSSQTTAGNDSWIGHVYNGTNQGVAYNGNFTNYVGNYTEPVLFDQAFGGNTNCFSIRANSSPISIYTETFSVRYRMNSTQKGLYTVSIGSDDGSRLSIDNNLVYNYWGDRGYAVDANILVNLTGNSKLVLDYYENGGGNRIGISGGTTPIIENTLTQNTGQSIPIGNTGQSISGDTYETYASTLPTGISRTGTGYQWAYITTQGGALTNITGATGATYTPSTTSGPFTTAGTYYIYRIATLSSTNNRLSSTYLARNKSNAATLTVGSGFTITQQPTDQTVCAGSPSTFSVDVDGQNLTYKWQRNDGGTSTNFYDIDGTDFTGTNSPVLTVNGASWLHDKRFRLKITDGSGMTAYSDSALLQYIDSPGYVNQAPNANVCSGQNTYFETQSSETNFQWELSEDGGNTWSTLVNDDNHQNVNQARLDIINATSAMNTNFYRVKVSRNGCALYAASSTLTVNDVPVITSQPSNQAVNSGSNVSFQSSATGMGLSYRWQANNGGGWYDIYDDGTYSGTGTTQLTLNNVQQWQSNYKFRLRVTNNSGCSSLSDEAVLTVGGTCGFREPIDIDYQNNYGNDTWIGHVYEGTNFDTYIGHYNEPETFDRNFGGDAVCFEMVAGGSVQTETFSVRYKMNSTRNGIYVVDMGSDDGTRLQVDGNLVFNNWVDQAHSIRPRVLFSLNGNSDLEYEFYESYGGNRVSFNNLLQIMENELEGNITQNYCTGDNTASITGDSFGTLPSGINPVGTGYQWTYSTSMDGTRTNISGATSASFTPNISSAPFNTPGTYYIFRNVNFSSSNNTGVSPYEVTHESNPATLEVNSQISNNEIIFRETGTVCATVNENGNLNISAPEGTVFTSVDFASYGTPDGTCENFTLGTCHATNSQTVVEGYLLGNNSATIPATNTVFGDPCSGVGKRLYVQATYAEPMGTLCSGDDPGTISGSTPESMGGDFIYSWQISNTGPESGFSEAPGRNELQDYNPGPLEQTTWFRRNILTDNCEPYSSNTIEIPVNPLPTGTLSGPTTVCQGEAAVLSATLTGAGPWTVTGSYGSGPTSFQVQQSPFSVTDYPTETTTYSITSVTDSNGCTNNEVSSVTVSVPSDVTNNTVTGDQSLCGAGTPEILSGSEATGSAVEYLWESSTQGSTGGFTPAQGTNNSKDYAPASVSQTTWFRRTASNNCSDAVSNVIEVTVLSPLSENNISLANGSNTLQSICTDTNPGIITGTVPSGGDGNFSYLWESSTTGADNGFNPAEGTNNTQNYDPGILSQSTWFRRTVSSTTCTEISSNVVEISVNPLPTITAINGDSSICIGETAYLTGNLTGTGPWTVRGTMDGAAFSISSTSPSLSYALSPTANTTINITGVEDANGCVNNETYTFTINVIQENTWTGTENTNWNNANNWSCNTLPTLETDALIPENLASNNYPLINTGANALTKNLSIENGASVTVSDNWLQIAGNLLNNGILNTEAGSISFQAASAQIIPDAAFQNNRIRNLRIDNTSGVISEAIIEVTGTLKIENGNFDTGNELTLISDENQTALISGAGNGEVIGLVSMQRYLDKAFGYKYFSSPFQNSVVGDFAPYMDFENPETGFPNFYRYNEDRNININEIVRDATGWEVYTNTTNSLNTAEGYALNFGNTTASQTIELTGEVNNGVIPARQLENNHREYTKGFHLVGNPYPSPIDWNANSGWTKTNIDDGIYFFTAGDDSQYTGTYSAYVNQVSTSDGRSSNIIPSMQGFFIKVSDSDTQDLVTGSFGMDNNVRINDFDQEFLRTQEVLKPLIRLEAGFNTSQRQDPMVIYFSSYATPNFEKEMDAHKLMNTDPAVPSFYNLTETKKELAINAIPFPESRSYKKIPLGIKADQNGEMKINLASVENLNSNFNIYLIDHEKGKGQNLRNNPKYTFNIQAGTHNSRFELMFSEEKVTSPAIAFNEPFDVEVEDGNVVVKMNLEENQEGILRASTMTGQILQIKEAGSKDQVIFEGITSEGVYIINLQVGKAQYGKKVLIKK
ncbi:hypothetical protein [Salegentibacter salegens]|uniref:Galactose binding lectin domain-containing protein n=1 Tax=Salegentibacter salegens TaxID=143223 RepID=A0A1M7IXE9_9FLAO|nr:hypothetical protein [Salegentibacter salegens]PRX49843.1 galactose binding lectin-like protein [Salegentibacter salegens]SHM45378.1 Galactose binding lectin domain-containing protein [Salegentibacter salegens]